MPIRNVMGLLGPLFYYPNLWQPGMRWIHHAIPDTSSLGPKNARESTMTISGIALT
jgi:hypothetical protein